MSDAPMPITVWYNTRCPVCDAGIDRQRNKLLAAARSGAIRFEDINLYPDALASYGLDVNDVRRRLHATDENGHLYAGIDCALAIWERTPGERWLARVFGVPGVRQVAGFAYDRFADILFAWNRRHGRW